MLRCYFSTDFDAKGLIHQRNPISDESIFTQPQKPLRLWPPRRETRSKMSRRTSDLSDCTAVHVTFRSKHRSTLSVRYENGSLECKRNSFIAHHTSLLFCVMQLNAIQEKHVGNYPLPSPTAILNSWHTPVNGRIRLGLFVDNETWAGQMRRLSLSTILQKLNSQSNR